MESPFDQAGNFFVLEGRYASFPWSRGTREKSLLVGPKVLFLPTEKVFTARDTLFNLIFRLLGGMFLSNSYKHMKEIK